MADDTAPSLPAFLPPPETPAIAAKRGVAVSAATNPDDEALYRDVARKTGMPLDSVRADPAAAQQRARITGIDYDGLALGAPKTTGWLSNPANAQVSHDDVGVLSNIESGIRNTGSAFVSGTFGLSSSLWGAIRAASEFNQRFDLQQQVMFGDNAPPNWLTRFATHEQQLGEGAAARWMPPGSGPISRALYSGVASLPLMAGAIGATATGNPEAAVGLFAGSAGGAAYGQAREAGLPPASAALHAGEQAAIAGMTASLPVGKLMGDIQAGAPFYKILAHQVVTDTAAMQLQRHASDFVEWANLHPEKTLGDFIAERPEAALDAELQALLFASVGAGVGHIVRGQARGEAQAAHADATTESLKGMMDLAAESKLRERSPQDFHDFLAQAAEDTPAEHLYIAPDKLAESLAQGGLEPQAQQEAEAVLGPRIAEAAEMGTDVRVPVSEFATIYADTPAGKALLDHVKTDPSGMTRDEAKLWQEQRGEEVKAEVEKILNDHAQAGANDEQVQLVKQKVLDQLNAANRFSQEVNDRYADLHAAFYRTMAERLGIDPHALYERYPIRVQAEPTGAPKFDQADVSSPAFKEWFGGSKVVDEKGQPLTVYHGTGSEFTAFKSPEGEHFFTESKPVAEQFGHKQMAVHLSVKDPLVVDMQGKSGKAVFDAIDQAKAAGNDGVIAKNVSEGEGLPLHTQFVAFRPEQIKSVDNSGAYDPSNPNIYKQESPVFYSALERAVEGNKTVKASPEQWLATLQKTPGVKKEEIEWTGLPEWLKMQGGPVTRDELLAFVREGGVKVEEVVKGAVDEDAVLELAADLRDTAIAVEASDYEPDVTVDYPEITEILDDEGDVVGYEVEGEQFDTEQQAQGRGDQIADERQQEAEDEARRDYEDRLGESFSWREYEDQARDQLQPEGQFAEYTEPGGEDYRELLLTLPHIDGPATHWDESNVVAHLRFKSRQSADGKPVMFIEEVQSDWHQKGRDQGYRQPVSEDERAATGKAEDEARVAVTEKATAIMDLAFRLGRRQNDTNFLQARKFLLDLPADHYDAHAAFDVVAAYDSAKLRLNEAEQAFRDAVMPKGIPDAPFKSSWPQLVMKRAIRWAVDNGFDQIAWTTGEQQRERYNLARTVDEIRARANGDGTYTVNAGYGISRAIVERGLATPDESSVPVMTPEQIHEVFGKDLGGRMIKLADEAPQTNVEPSQRLSSDEPPKFAEVRLDGEDLKIGGEGMLGFYDRNLVNMTNDIIKKYGAKVEPVAINDIGRNRDRQVWEQYAKDYETTGMRDAAEESRRSVEALGPMETNPGFTITPELKKVASEGFALFQKERGSYSPSTDTITLTKSADLSTYLHESGHFFLEMMDRLASDTNAPQEVTNDFGALLDWFGVKDKAAWDSMSLEEKRASHEKFAQGFEAYLFSGKSPSLRMQSLFQRFRSWLVSVYKKATSIGAQPSPAVRGVMDRMLATDAEIHEAEAARSMEPLFKDEAASGMNPDQWREYQAQGQEATAQAVSDLEGKSLRDMQWLRNARGREVSRLKRRASATRSLVREQVAREVMAEPVYRAQQFLKRGVIDGVKVDGPHRMSIAEVDALYGDSGAHKTIKDALGYGAYGMLSEAEGIHPEQVAEQFGYTSADHMIRDLLAAEPLKERIDGMTEQRLLEQHGDLSDPASIEQAADKAIHNDARARFVATELAALDKATGKAALLAKAARSFAETTVARLKVRDIRPSLYETAAARAGKAATSALAKGDITSAAAEKRNQLVNTYATKAAHRAQDDVEKALGYFKKFSRPGVRKNLRGEFLAQIDNILARFDLRTSLSNKAIDETRVPLAKWVEDESERLSAVVPALPAVLLNENVKTHYRNLTVEDLRGVVDGMKQLERLARREQTMYLAIKDQQFGDEREALLGRIRETYPSGFDPVLGSPLGQAPDFVPSYAKAFKALGPKFTGEFINAETMTSMLDGGRIGPVYDSVFSRLTGRSDWKAERLGAIHAALKPLFDAYSFAEKRAYSRRGYYVDAIGDSLTRENALVVALLAGSEDGRARLANYGWGPDHIAHIVDLLDARDMALADGIWRLFDENLWPELDALNQRTRGSSPPKVEALPYETRHGTARGGYFRLKYDTELDERAHRYDEGQAVREMLGGSLGMSAKTNQGTSTERLTKVSMRPRLDLGVFSETVQETVHDLAYREAVADTMRMLNDRGVQNAIKNAVGTPGYRALVTRVREVAAPPRNPSGFIERAVGIAKRNTITNLMSGVKTALQNITGILPAFARVHPGYLSAEIARTFSPAIAERQALPNELSSYMRGRTTHYDRDLTAGIDKMRVQGKLLPDTGAFLWLMTRIDKTVANVVWNAAYREGLARNANDHDRAVQHADHIVRQTQGSGRDVDLPKIMSGHGGYGTLKRVFTMFHSYMNGQLNALVQAGAIAKQEARTDPAGATARYAAKAMLIVALPAILTEMTLGNSAASDEDWSDTLKRYARVTTTWGAGFVPIARDFAGVLWAQFDSAAPDYGYKLSPLQSAGEGVVRGAKAAKNVAKGEGTKADTKALILAGGYITGTPGKLISDTVMGTDAWLSGEAGPQAVVLGPPRSASR